MNQNTNEAGKLTGSSIPCVIRTEGGPEGGRPSRLEIDGAFSARNAIERAITLAKELRAFVDFAIDGVEQQVCWTSDVDTILVLHERQRDHRKLSEVSVMGHCKDCKHWESHTAGPNKSWHTCEAPDWVDYDAKIGDGDFAIYAHASDDTGLTAGLKTGPMFGCIKFQPHGKKTA
jgi:hypothetical protein